MSKEIKYFRIKNWEKYQHRDAIRGSGPMKFIRMNVDLLWDEKTRQLSASSRLTWMLLLLYSGATRNLLPWSPTLLKSILGTHRIPNLALFESLGLIEVFDASKMPATCAQNASPEKRRAEESRVDKSNRAKKEHTHKNNDDADAKISESASKEKSSGITEKVLQIWNEQTGLKTKGLFPRRLDLVLKHFEEKPDLSYWIDIFKRVRNSEFLMGNQKKWKMTLEWAMSHHIEISEGKYDDEEYCDKHFAIPLRSNQKNESKTA